MDIIYPQLICHLVNFMSGSPNRRHRFIYPVSLTDSPNQDSPDTAVEKKEYQLMAQSLSNFPSW